MSNVGLYEERVRVICHLPCKNAKHEQAIQDILKYLRAQRTASISVTGYTISSPRPIAFFGSWFGKPLEKLDEPNTKNRWIPDKIVLLMTDYEISFSDARLTGVVRKLKESLHRAYATNRCPETDFWVVAHQLFRQD